MERYKSWMDMRKRLQESACDALKGRITYFLTRYYDVHNAYGRAAVRLDGNEMVCFSWTSVFRQEEMETPHCDRDALALQWDRDCTYGDIDFLLSVQEFFHLGIGEARSSANGIIRMLAILDRRTGKRTLRRILDAGDYEKEPDWVKQFYRLRFAAEGMERAVSE